VQQESESPNPWSCFDVDAGTRN